MDTFHNVVLVIINFSLVVGLAQNKRQQKEFRIDLYNSETEITV